MRHKNRVPRHDAVRYSRGGTFMLHIRCDTHTHTIYSRHAYSTVEENVRAAAELGIGLLGSTDHYSSMLFPEVEDRLFGVFGG